MKTDVEYCIRVAEACGFEYKTEPKMSGEKVNLRVRVPGAWRPFFPDVNWDSAMFAAGDVGLFSTLGCLLTQDVSSKRWVVEQWRGAGSDVVSQHDAGPYAICESILKLIGED